MPVAKGIISIVVAGTALLLGGLPVFAAPPKTVVPLPQKPLSPAQVTTALNQAKQRLPQPVVPPIVSATTIDQAALNRLTESYYHQYVAQTKAFESQFQSAAASQNILAASRATQEAAQLRQQLGTQALAQAAQLQNYAAQQRIYAMQNTHDAAMARIDAQNARVSANLAATEAFLMQHQSPTQKSVPFKPVYTPPYPGH